MLNIWGVNPVAPADSPKGLIINRGLQEKSPRRRQKLFSSLSRSPGYLPISSIPHSSSSGLNYTFVSGSLCKRTKQTILPQCIIDPEQLSNRAKRKVIRSPFHKTPETLKHSSQEVVLTIDTRLDTNNDEVDRDRQKSVDRPSFLNENSSFAKNNSVSRGMMETHDGDESDSQYQDYVKDSVPGPGAYNVESTLLDKKRHSLFISKAERFNTKRQSPEPEKEQDKPQRKRPLKLREKLRSVQYRKYYPFESSQPRIVEQKVDFVPGPGYYRPRQSIEEELIKKIQRDFKGRFGREEQRFRVDKNLNEQLGPGYYTIQNKEAEQAQPSSYFKSVVKRQLFNKPPRIPGVGTYEHEQSPVKLFEAPDVEAPFGAKSRRFSEFPTVDRNLGQYTDSLDILGSRNLFDLYKKRQEEYTKKGHIRIPNKYYSPKMAETPGPGHYTYDDREGE